MNILFKLILLVSALCTFGCASGREFWTYVVEEPVKKPLIKDNSDTPIASPVAAQYVKVQFNDGSLSTEVQIPVLSVGQQIVIDHKGKPSEKGLSLLPLPPTLTDKTLEDTYLKNGGVISATASPVSIVKTRAEIHNLVKQGNYSLALEYATQLLARYPNHAETLRTKGALLLKMGERSAARESYQKAQDIEPQAKVQKQIDAIEKAEEQ